jgi:hypothetical protein
MFRVVYAFRIQFILRSGRKKTIEQTKKSKQNNSV